MIDRATIERIKEAADIVDVVSEFVSLRRAGSSYKGLCPFHSDSNPSFSVSPSRGTCHCFTCGEGGDSVGFLMKHEQLSYPEALRWLAKRYGIEIQEKEMTDEQRRKQNEREDMFIVNEWASAYYKDILHNDVDGRAVGMQYFRQRGVRDDIIEKFHLGFAPVDRYAMPRTAKEKGYNLDNLEKVGLCYKDNKGQFVDRFANRVIFPWIGVSGKTVAFGGRVLDARTKGVSQKYVNSPDSVIYHKDHELYGIYQAKKEIARQDCVYMVEGYTDVISMHQCGLENVVANSGTALSVHQIHLLHRFTSNIVLVYDGDEAGIHAALRGTDMLLADGMNVKVLLLPDGDDPDSFAKKHNADEFRKYIKDHQTDIIEFKTRVLLEGVSDPHKRSAAINSIIESVSWIGDQIERSTYIKDCASRLGIDEQTLINQMNGFIRKHREENRRYPTDMTTRTPKEPVNGVTQNGTSHGGSMQNGASPAQPGGVGQQPSVGSSNQEMYGEIPPEAFLPPEAFTQTGASDGSGASAGNDVAQGNGTAGQTYSTGAGGNGTKTKNKITQDVSSLLIQAIIRYGERVLYDNVEAEDGSTLTFTVAQWIQYDLGTDDLKFTNPVYNQILNESAEKSGTEGFIAEKYFINHADLEVSQLAIRLGEEEVVLTKAYQMNYDDVDRLREYVNHLLADFRMEYINQRLKSLRMDIGLNAKDGEKMISLMAEYQKMQALLGLYAKKAGVSIRPR